MKKLSPYLTFAGSIPFIACAILLIVGVDSVLALGKTSNILATYGLVIATFMAGAQWGNHLAFKYFSVRKYVTLIVVISLIISVVQI
ncbi:DUF3429 family protein [uncultured Psychrobacter sp.]|uniref:DUF3429 domain-containing protein n=1 Tax=uncultured Psychrobacter sp. TaxID=259303 RepID=UPI002634ABC2|nr:DUF3429 family protein [uncultured Psychrobacter sp.]